MSVVSVEYEVRYLLDTSLDMYAAIGLSENPFYYFSQNKSDAANLRTAAGEELYGEAQEGPFLYLTGDIKGGTGKSYLIDTFFSRLSRRDDIAVIKLRDIVRYRFPLCVVQAVMQEISSFIRDSGELPIYCLLDEVEFNGIYSQCVVAASRVIAAGHYLYRDAGDLRDKFEVVDLDERFPIAKGIVYDHLERLLKGASLDPVLSDEVVWQIADTSPTVGTAELVCGLLLATTARRATIGETKPVCKDDVHKWIRLIPTDWFWFSMDCWRVKNPVSLEIERTIAGVTSRYRLQATIGIEDLERIEID